MSNSDQQRAELRQAALEYHEFPTPGKIAISATKQLVNQRDLAAPTGGCTRRRRGGWTAATSTRRAVSR